MVVSSTTAIAYSAIYPLRGQLSVPNLTRDVLVVLVDFTVRAL
jgi:hypothetical protein